MKLQKPEECNCSECGLAQAAFVPWYYPPGADVLLVAQAPGEVETWIHKPLIGPAGKTEWRICKTAGLDKNNFAQTNVCACWPPDDRKPTDNEMACCFPRLKAEILLTQPNLIVALGDVSIYALTGIRRPVKSTRGQFFPLLDKYDYSCNVLCCLHPSFVMRQRQWFETAVADHRLILNPPTEVSTIEETQSEITHITNPSPSELADYLSKGRKFKPAFDIETPGELNPRRAEVIGIAFAYKPNEAIGMDLVKGDERWNIVKQFLEDRTVEKTTQNGSFDLECLHTNGVEVQGMTFDTKLAEHILNSDLPTGLDYLRGRYTTIPPYKPTRRDMKLIGKWSSERRITYNNLDAITTWIVAQEQQQLMDQDDWSVLNEIEMPLIPALNKMQRRGMLVDVETLAVMSMRLEPKIEELNKKWFAPIGLTHSQNIALAKHLGLDSVDEDTLTKQIKRGHDQANFMQALLDVRNMDNLNKKYLLGIFQRLEEGRIHTSFLSEIAGTGRLACRNPNLQNVPKYMRVIYIADPGKQIIEGDWKQLEFVVWAVIAPEPKLLADIKKGVDVHDMLCKAIFGKPKSMLTERQVLREKAVVFGTMGGRTARSIAMEFGVSTLVAESWQRAVVAKYPGFSTYIQKQTKLFNNGNFVRTPFGRKRQVQTPTQALNTPFQGSAADVAKSTIVALDKANFELHLTVHDSIIVEADTKDAVEVAHEQQKIMQRSIKQLNNHQFKAKMGTGVNWYELKELK